MNIHTAIALKAFGTSEGVMKEWEERARKVDDPDIQSYTEKCIGSHCGNEAEVGSAKNSAIPLPHLGNIELEMQSDAADRNIHFDKEALKAMLRMALVQLDRDDVDVKYINEGGQTPDKSTDHYASIKFTRRGITGATRK